MTATTFPTTLDTFTTVTTDEANNSPLFIERIAKLQNAVAALETKVGVGAGAGLTIKEYAFTETATAAGTYTASCSVPAGAWLVEVALHATAVFDSAGAVTGIVGDVADDDGIFTAVDMKATDLTAGQGIAASGGTGTSGAQEGADIIATHWNRRYLATARVITCKLTFAGTGGTAGRARFIVAYMVDPSPTAHTFTAA
jgi:hypothetical protein